MRPTIKSTLEFTLNLYEVLYTLKFEVLILWASKLVGIFALFLCDRGLVRPGELLSDSPEDNKLEYM